MPFWVIAVTLILGMTFFVSSYFNTVAWHIHAQNAADSAASAGLSVQANILNEETTLLYTTSVDEFRIRAVNQAMINAMNGVGGCKATGTCNSDYTVLLGEYNQLVAQSGSFASDIQLLKQANNFSEGGQQADMKKAIKQFGTGCGTAGGGFDCQFTYNIISETLTTGNGKKRNGIATVDLVACRLVPYFPLFVGAQTSFRAVGRAAASLVPTSDGEFFTPSSAQQPIESKWNGNTLADIVQAYYVDFSGLSTKLSWYTTASIPDTGTTVTYDPGLNNAGNSTGSGGTYGCATQ